MKFMRKTKYIQGSLTKQTLPKFLALKKINPSFEPRISWYDENKVLVLSFTKSLTKEMLSKIKYNYEIDSDGYLILYLYEIMQ